MKDKPAILFLCVHNAGRSQMAAAFARFYGGEDVRVHSAGSAPGRELHPVVLEAMRERGLDLSSERPQRLDDEVGRSVDVIITMGCGDECPVYPGRRYEDWVVADPAGQDLEVVRAIRDDIEARVQAVVRELLKPSSDSFDVPVP